MAFWKDSSLERLHEHVATMGERGIFLTDWLRRRRKGDG